MNTDKVILRKKLEELRPPFSLIAKCASYKEGFEQCRQMAVSAATEAAPVAAIQPAGDEDFPSDLIGRLREYAGNPNYSHGDYADTMRQAADELSRPAASAPAQPEAKGAAPHWLDSPQSALNGKTAREGYAANPEYAHLFADEPNLWKRLANRALEVLNRHIVPDGISDNAALIELYGIFDGPEYRAALAAPVPAAPADKMGDQWHSLTCDGTCNPPCKDAPADKGELLPLPDPEILYQADREDIIGYTADQVRACILADRASSNAAWVEHLREGETPLARLQREIKDSDSLATLLASARQAAIAQPSGDAPDEEQGWAYGRAKASKPIPKWAEVQRCAEEFGGRVVGNKLSFPTGEGKALFDIWYAENAPASFRVRSIFKPFAAAPQPPSTGIAEDAEVTRALKDACNIAMRNSVAARIPECGDFAAIAQNLSWAIAASKERGGDALETIDPVVENVRAALLQRSQFGIKKYGDTLHNKDYSEREILQHAIEESMDLSNYLMARIMKIDAAIVTTKAKP